MSDPATPQPGDRVLCVWTDPLDEKHIRTFTDFWDEDVRYTVEVDDEWTVEVLERAPVPEPRPEGSEWAPVDGVVQWEVKFRGSSQWMKVLAAHGGWLWAVVQLEPSTRRIDEVVEWRRPEGWVAPAGSVLVEPTPETAAPICDDDRDYLLARQLAEALRLTEEYLRPSGVLPAVEGWSWFDALEAYADVHRAYPRTWRVDPAPAATGADPINDWIATMAAIYSPNTGSRDRVEWILRERVPALLALQQAEPIGYVVRSVNPQQPGSLRTGVHWDLDAAVNDGDNEVTAGCVNITLHPIGLSMSWPVSVPPEAGER